MYCKNCGFEITGEVNFCVNCGKPVNDSGESDFSNGSGGFYQGTCCDDEAKKHDDRNKFDDGKNYPGSGKTHVSDSGSGSETDYGTDYGSGSGSDYSSGDYSSPDKSKIPFKLPLNLNRTGMLAVGLVFVLIVAGGIFFVSGFLSRKNTSDFGNYPSENQNAAQNNYDKDNMVVDGDDVIVPNNTFSGGAKYTTEEIYMRSGPGTDYNQIKTLPRGTQVELRGEDERDRMWVYVCVYGNTYGWVYSEYLTINHVESTAVATTAPTTKSGSIYTYRKFDQSFIMYVNDEEGLHMRNGASRTATSYGVMPDGREVTILGESTYDTNWYYATARVEGVTRTGFVYKQYLTK